MAIGSSSRRHRWIYRHLSQHLKDALHSQTTITAFEPFTSHDHIPCLSEDTALTAFAQLAAVRLGADRGLLSLIDDENQYILSESTQKIRLRVDNRQDAVDQLWLGSAMASRSQFVCSQALDVDVPAVPRGRPVLIPDLSQDSRFQSLPLASGPCGFRFYAAAPLYTPDGTIVGSICVYSTEPRHDVPQEDLALLEDLAATAVEHLSAAELRQNHEQGERMVRGLINFVDGADELKNHYGKYHGNTLHHTAVAPARPKNPQRRAIRHTQKMTGTDSAVVDTQFTSSSTPKADTTSPTAKISSGGTSAAKHKLQDHATSDAVRSMFSRAANVIRETSNLNGVIIFDTSVAALGDRAKVKPSKDSASPSASCSEKDLGSEGSTEAINPSRTSQVLGFSLEYEDHTPDDVQNILQSLPESVLLSMLKRFPSGKIFSINVHGELSTSEDSDSTTGEGVPNQVGNVSVMPTGQSRPHRRSTKLQRIGEALQKIAPNALSIACLPLWDHDRARWYAMALVWTKRLERTLNAERDLLFLKAFGNSIMTELSRLEHVASNQTKSTFIASISHELRSPLHGILGGVEFLQDTNLDLFQKSMLHSISNCGHTLLDTLSHVLDFADVSQLNKRKRPLHKRSISNEQQLSVTDINNASSVVDLSIATEQVVEAIFASQSYRVIQKASGQFNSGAGSGKRTQWSASSISLDSEDRKLTLLILDIACEKNWRFKISSGAWARLVMNLLGNALKYTSSGSIRLCLTADASRKRSGKKVTPIQLTITDTGIGMSPEFVKDKLFVPFEQENALSTGIGLGMSIVRHIVDTLQGKIEIDSALGVGTAVKVKLELDGAGSSARTSDDNDLDSLQEMKSTLRGRKICIQKPQRVPTAQTFVSDAYSAMDSLINALLSMFTEWLAMDVIISDDWYGHKADVVMLVEPSFEYLASIRASRAPNDKCPITIFMTIDAIEAAALRADARVLSQESVVEICTQPCGPYKMAALLTHCLARYEHEAVAPRTSHESPALQWTENAARASTPSQDLISDLRNAPTITATRLKVLIVDDNVINRRLLVAFCKRHDLNFVEASDGLQAVAEFEMTQKISLSDKEALPEHVSVNPAFDIVLMDLSMPIMDGMTATREIRKLENKWHQNGQIVVNAPSHSNRVIYRPAHIIALTGLASPSARFEAMEAGVDVYMTKPVKFELLQQVINRCISGENPVAEYGDAAAALSQGAASASEPPERDGLC